MEVKMPYEQIQKILETLEQILLELKTLPHYYPNYTVGYTYPYPPCPHCGQYHQ